MGSRVVDGAKEVEPEDPELVSNLLGKQVTSRLVASLTSAKKASLCIYWASTILRNSMDV